MHMTMKHLMVECFACLLLLTGCATPGGDRKLPTKSNSLGPVLVLPINARNFSYLTPMEKGESAEALARDGLLIGANPLGIFMIPLTVPLGAAFGAAKGVNYEQIQAAEGQLLEACRENPIENRLCRALCKQGVEETGLAWVSAIDEPGIIRNSPANTSLILEMEFLTYALEPRGWFGLVPVQDKPFINPNMALIVTVRCNLVRPSDKEEIHTQTWKYVGDRHRFLAWAKDDAALLKQALEQCSEELAKRIRRDLFQR
jgi:hypothetical protein